MLSFKSCSFIFYLREGIRTVTSIQNESNLPTLRKSNTKLIVTIDFVLLQTAFTYATVNINKKKGKYLKERKHDRLVGST